MMSTIILYLIIPNKNGDIKLVDIDMVFESYHFYSANDRKVNQCISQKNFSHVVLSKNLKHSKSRAKV